MISDLEVIKISQLGQVTNPQSSDEIPVNNLGVTRKMNPAQLSSDYKELAVAPRLTDTYGQSSFGISFDNVNYTGSLSKGMKMIIPRSVTPQTRSAALNGTNQNFSKITPGGMTYTDDFVGGGWVKITNYSASNMAIISRYNGTSGFILQVVSNGTIMLVALNGGATNQSNVQTFQAIPLNRWVHISAQIDMSSFTATSTTSYIMIDGVDVPVQIGRGGTNPTSLVQAGNLEVGSANNTTFFQGSLAQIFVSSAKITQANIRNFMYAGITPAAISANNIVSAYSFDNNSNDLNTTTANNLTANNGASSATVDTPFAPFAAVIIMNDPSMSGSNTIMIVQAANGYSVPNDTLEPASYATVGTPYGFPMESNKWAIYVVLGSNIVRSSPTSGTYYADSAISAPRLVVPTGEWNISWVGALTVALASGSGPIGGEFALSTLTTAFSDMDLVGSNRVYSASTSGFLTTLSRSKPYSASAMTTFYAVLYPLDANMSTINMISKNQPGANYGSMAVFKAENVYIK